MWTQNTIDDGYSMNQLFTVVTFARKSCLYIVSKYMFMRIGIRIFIRRLNYEYVFILMCLVFKFERSAFNSNIIIAIWYDEFYLLLNQVMRFHKIRWKHMYSLGTHQYHAEQYHFNLWNVVAFKISSWHHIFG